jgi:ABC-type phosphate transport system permease subunit
MIEDAHKRLGGTMTVRDPKWVLPAIVGSLWLALLLAALAAHGHSSGYPPWAMVLIWGHAFFALVTGLMLAAARIDGNLKRQYPD